VPKNNSKFKINLAGVCWNSHIKAHQAYPSCQLEPRISYDWKQYYPQTFQIATLIIECLQTMGGAK
jgi:hypothetical protein